MGNDLTTMQKIKSLNNMNAAAQRTQLGTLLFNSASGGYPSDYPGKIYFVNNISGASTNDGLTWETAFDQVSTAVTAWETYRATLAANNQNIRGIIYVQGTGTAYNKLTALPSYCDIIGVGAMPYGDGAGIPVISGASVSAPAPAIAGTARGLRLFGLQFLTNGAFYCADFVSLFRSEIAFCAFKASDPTLLTVVTLGGMRFSGNSGGNYIHDNMWMAANDSWFTWGIHIDTTVVIFNETRIENNMIMGETAGMYVAPQTVTADSVYVNQNQFGGGNHTSAVGVDDNSTSGDIVYSGNWICATDGGQLANNGAARWVGNYRINDFSAVTAS